MSIEAVHEHSQMRHSAYDLHSIMHGEFQFVIHAMKNNTVRSSSLLMMVNAQRILPSQIARTISRPKPGK